MLLRAVCESPDDDTPRLVFADWLDENGESERAEFIRVQIAIAPGEPDPKAIARADSLLGRHKRQWAAELPTHMGWVWGKSWSRGFVEALLVTSDMAGPPHNPDPAQAFAAAPIINLEIMEHTIGPWIPHVRHVRTLKLSGARLTRAEAAALCSPAVGTRPTSITISGGFQFEEGVVELLQSQFGDVVRVLAE